MKRILYWFRNDLRLHDNEGFARSVADADYVLPVFIFDPRWFRELPRLSIRKTGAFRTHFLLEAVADLRQSLRSVGADLIVRVGDPAKLLAELADDIGAKAIYASKEVTQEETDVESDLSKRLKPLNVDIDLFWVSTLYHIHDLPFGIARLPDAFTEFCSQVEQYVNVRAPIPTPERIRLVPDVDAGDLPGLATFGFPNESIPALKPAAQPSTIGGETTARQYVRATESATTRPDDSATRLSAGLALGCLSPRYLYQEIRRHHDERIDLNSPTLQPVDGLIPDLIRRDFFRFIALRYGTRIFKPGGIRLNLSKQWRHDPDQFRRWAIGQTGIPFIDATMREVNATGFTSNQGRQAVVSFFVNDLGIDWTWGAAWFESLLVDYDPCGNWVSWNYAAGVGNDSRQAPYVNIYTQALRYDAQETYVRHWLPELDNVPADRIHLISTMPEDELARYGIKLGGNYPLPIINPDKWLTPEKNH